MSPGKSRASRRIRVLHDGEPISLRGVAKSVKSDLVEEGYVSTAAVVAKTGISPNMLKKWRTAGLVKAKNFKGSWHYLESDLIRAIRESF